MARRKIMWALSSRALWLTLAAVYAAQVAGPGIAEDKVTIQLSYSVGEKTWYKISMDGTTEISGSVPGASAAAPGGGQPVPVHIEIVFSVQARSRDEASNWVIEQTIHDFEMTAMGIDMSQVFSGAKGIPVTVTQDKLGNVVKLEGLPAFSGTGPMNPAGFSAITLAPRMLSFPEREVGVGESWQLQTSESAKEQLRQADADMTATLVSLDEMGGDDCAVIKVVSKAAPELKGALPGSDAAASVKTQTDLVCSVRLSDAKILAMEGKMISEIASRDEGGFGAKNDMKITMKETSPPVEVDRGREGG